MTPTPAAPPVAFPPQVALGVRSGYYPSQIPGEGLEMRGSIHGRGTCRCGGGWKEDRVRGKLLGLVCDRCGGQPRAVYIDARGFRDRTGNVGRIYTDDDDRLLSWPVAERLLEAIRRDKDALGKSFVVAKWKKSACKGFKLADCGARWIEYLRETRSKTYADHQSIFLGHVERRMGNVDVREIRSGAVEDLYRDLLQSFAPKSVQSILFALRTLLNWLRRREELEKIPAFPQVALTRVPPRTITRAEQDAVIAAAPENYRLIFRLLVETGIRPGEAGALPVGHIQEGGVVISQALDECGKVKTTKKNKIQFKRVSDALYADLVAAGKGKLPGAFLFTQPSGAPMRTSALSRNWKRAALAAKLDAPLYEGTRHSFATRLRLEKEREMGAELAREMGHGKVATTLTHYAPNKK